MPNSGGVNLLTLAAQTAILISGPSMTRGGRILSLRGSFAIFSLTAGDGPWLVGIKTADLTLAELEEYLELNGPINPGDRVSMERSGRGAVIRTLGHIVPQGDGTVASLYFDNKSLSGLKFDEEAGGWEYWLYNLGKAMTTGAVWRQALQMFVEFNPSG